MAWSAGSSKPCKWNWNNKGPKAMDLHLGGKVALITGTIVTVDGSYTAT
jgi:hypothetical protein